jgi:hypothetical protein
MEPRRGARWKHTPRSIATTARQDVLRWTLTLSGAVRTSIACLTQTPGIDTNELYRGTAWRVMYSSMDRSGPM